MYTARNVRRDGLCQYDDSFQPPYHVKAVFPALGSFSRTREGIILKQRAESDGLFFFLIFRQEAWVDVFL